MDFLRRRRRQDEFSSDEDPDMTIDETTSADIRHVAAASLRTFMQLPIAQRGASSWWMYWATRSGGRAHDRIKYSGSEGRPSPGAHPAA